MNIFQRIYNKIRDWKTPDWLRVLINKLWDIIKEAISASAEIILAQLIELAKEACLKVKEDSSLVTDDEKRKKAFEEILKSAKERSLQTTDHLINLAIEIAMAWLKKRNRI